MNVLGATTHRRQHGVTLIEVLITMVVTAIGLLGFAALQTVTMKSNRTALHHSMATFYAYDILDCMRANRPAAVAQAYDTDFDDGPPSTPATIVDADLAAWKNALSDNLPTGEGSITVDASGNASVQIRWVEQDPTDPDDPERIATFPTSTRL